MRAEKLEDLLIYTKALEQISREEEIAVSGLYQDLADMLSAFILYLRLSDRNRW